jgi:hypothetical protein
MQTIYKITNLVTNQIYVGQTSDASRRFKDYRLRLAPGQSKLHESFLDYGVLNHKFEIICNCDDGVTDKLEIYFISHYKSLFYTNRQFGLNLSRGGRRGSAHPNETKAKIAKALTGKKQSVETINKKRLKNSKPAILLDKNFDIYRTFSSIVEAAAYLKITPRAATTLASGIVKGKYKNKREYYLLREKDYRTKLVSVKKYFLIQ